ncbi:MAG: peptidylprolyl isomerase [Polyangiaceae bacterium]|nr:peptidylprolyl isomerase [Polyangiaceae bacterium]
MNIQDDCYVSISYRLASDAGELIDETEDGQPLAFIFGRGQMIAGLERRLAGMTVGERAEVVVEPEDGYGPVIEELFYDLPRDSFPDDIELEPGLRLRANGPNGPLSLKVRSIQGDAVTVDLNHPLAGQRLHFDVTVVECREATTDEILAMISTCSPSDCASCCGGCHQHGE